MKSLAVALLALVATTSAASAGTKSLHITRSQFSVVIGQADLNSDQMVRMTSAGSSVIAVSFVLPNGFLKNSTAKFDLYLEGADNNCSYQITTEFLQRNRLGYDEGYSENGNQSGFVAASAGLTPAPASGTYRVFKKTFLIKKPVGMTVPGQKAGDTITLGIKRDPIDVGDNCGNLYISGAKLIYKTP